MKEFQEINTGQSLESNPRNGLLTVRLVDCIYENIGKYLAGTTLLGIGVTGYVGLNFLNLDNSSYNNLILKGITLGISTVVGGVAGFTGGLVGGMGIVFLSDKTENLEMNLRNRFSKNIT